MSSYDQNLLDEAPKATRAQLQEGYNVDLLEQPPRRTPSVRHPPSQPAPVSVPQAIPENGTGEKFDSSPASKPRTSFWRTRNGIITIAIIALVVIGAVVGGAVGGTVKKSSNDSVDTTGSSSSHSSSTTTKQGTSSQTSTGTQGIAPATGRPSAPGFTPSTSASPSATSTTGSNMGGG